MFRTGRLISTGRTQPCHDQPHKPCPQQGVYLLAQCSGATALHLEIVAPGSSLSVPARCFPDWKSEENICPAPTGTKMHVVPILKTSHQETNTKMQVNPNGIRNIRVEVPLPVRNSLPSHASRCLNDIPSCFNSHLHCKQQGYSQGTAC